MNTDLLIIGGLLLLMGFLVGVKKQTWLLSGFNEKRVSNKDRLAKLVGGFVGIMGVIFIIAGVFSFQSVMILVAILFLGLFGLIIYSNVKLVDQ
ncbi:DUF3784 domain-containing protein [Gracilibacillus oryzae]|uniref:DUF3784 domain-containing protein n=1 Tax=Gracilibacillus oryzae TaxID=1672701 RepID=A0A7C8GTS2_9BACI|nr:DUF3784 domain-containing protein [Gracilibacillus oryzae]KAB8133618.1 DUF3784 domain-containing protein [Gracilibacillus oryzae]